MKTISRIAYSNDKRNKTRSILIMMSICLTTMLLVIISTVGNGVIHLQKSQAASSYGSNYGLFIAVDGTQLKEVERRAEISDIGIMCTEGILKENENGGFVSADETVRKMLPYNQEYVLKEGTYPEKAQEIAAGRAFFDAVGYHDVKVGDTVTLEYRSGMQSEYAPVEFTVSGILYDRDEYTIEASYVVFGSQDFYNGRVAEGDRQYNIYFTLSDSANVSMNNVAPVIKEIADSCGIDQKNVIINDLYLQWVLQPSYEMIVVCGTLILGIVLFSVVVIYNIFQVGIAQGSFDPFFLNERGGWARPQRAGPLPTADAPARFSRMTVARSLAPSATSAPPNTITAMRTAAKGLKTRIVPSTMGTMAERVRGIMPGNCSRRPVMARGSLPTPSIRSREPRTSGSTARMVWGQMRAKAEKAAGRRVRNRSPGLPLSALRSCR